MPRRNSPYFHRVLQTCINFVTEFDLGDACQFEMLERYEALGAMADDALKMDAGTFFHHIVSTDTVDGWRAKFQELGVSSDVVDLISGENSVEYAFWYFVNPETGGKHE